MSLNLAGSANGNVANKYKNKGLRVIAVDKDASQIEETVKKWKTAGANYPLYTVDYCSFVSFYEKLDTYPSSYLIKDFTLVKEIKGNPTAGETDIKNAFGF